MGLVEKVKLLLDTKAFERGVDRAGKKLKTLERTTAGGKGPAQQRLSERVGRISSNVGIIGQGLAGFGLVAAISQLRGVLQTGADALERAFTSGLERTFGRTATKTAAPLAAQAKDFGFEAAKAFGLAIATQLGQIGPGVGFLELFFPGLSEGLEENKQRLLELAHVRRLEAEAALRTARAVASSEVRGAARVPARLRELESLDPAAAQRIRHRIGQDAASDILRAISDAMQRARSQGASAGLTNFYGLNGP